MQSAYQLACGASDLVESTDKERLVELWREHGVYHVRFVDWSTSPVTREWLSFHTIREAQASFRKFSKSLEGKR